MKGDFFGGIGEICGLQGIAEQSRDALQHEIEILLAVNSRQIVDEEIVRVSVLKTTHQKRGKTDNKNEKF